MWMICDHWGLWDVDVDVDVVDDQGGAGSMQCTPRKGWCGQGAVEKACLIGMPSIGCMRWKPKWKGVAWQLAWRKRRLFCCRSGRAVTSSPNQDACLGSLSWRPEPNNAPGPNDDDDVEGSSAALRSVGVPSDARPGPRLDWPTEVTPASVAGRSQAPGI
jgi:hypothetical protein